MTLSSNIRTVSAFVVDDGVTTLPLPAGHLGSYVVVTEHTGQYVQCIMNDTGGTAAIQVGTNSANGVLDTTTGTLAGTTGTDGKMTVRNDQATDTLYVENRLGSSRTLSILFVGKAG